MLVRGALADPRRIEQVDREGHRDGARLAGGAREVAPEELVDQHVARLSLRPRISISATFTTASLGTSGIPIPVCTRDREVHRQLVRGHGVPVGDRGDARLHVRVPEREPGRLTAGILGGREPPRLRLHGDPRLRRSRGRARAGRSDVRWRRRSRRVGAPIAAIAAGAWPTVSRATSAAAATRTAGLVRTRSRVVRRTRYEGARDIMVPGIGLTRASYSGLSAPPDGRWAYGGPAILHRMDAERTILRAGHLVDVVGEAVLAAQAITIEGDRIVGRRARRRIGRGPGDRVIDLTGHTVLARPDGHARAHDRERRTGSETYAALVVRSPRPGGDRRGAERARHADGGLHDGARRRAPSARSSTSRCATRSTPAGRPGPRMFCAGRLRHVVDAAAATSPGSRSTSTSGSRATCGSASRTRPTRSARWCARSCTAAPTSIKVIATGAVLTEGTNPGAPEFSEDEIRAAVEEAALYDTYVAAHAHGRRGDQARGACGRRLDRARLADGRRVHRADGRARHVPGRRHLLRRLDRGGGHARGVVRRAPCGRTARPPTPSARASRSAVKAGVKIAYGTDSGVYPHG